MKGDVVDPYEPILEAAREAAESGKSEAPFDDDDVFQRYDVNVIVDNAGATGAPVIYEANPTYQNLIGRVEYFSVMGALLTNFTMIKPGALHRANGGYLVLDAAHVLSHPFVWDGLKRALLSESIRIESPVGWRARRRRTIPASQHKRNRQRMPRKTREKASRTRFSDNGI